MLRPYLCLNTIFLALGGFVAVALPFSVRAQSGDALARAERTCLDNGLGPSAVAYDTCVARAASAYDQGSPGLADREARRIADARQACLTYGIDPMTLGYRQCVANETNMRRYEITYVPQGRASGGFHYDATACCATAMATACRRSIGSSGPAR
jgi:hypothetical protein